MEGTSKARTSNKKAYTQFSKRMVLLVFWGVVVLTCAVMALLFFGVRNAPETVEAYKAFMTFAGAVFVCYSGNSAFEKFVLGRYAEDVSRHGREAQGAD